MTVAPRGLTLVELLVGLAVSGILVAAVATGFQRAFQVERLVDGQMQRAVAAQLATAASNATS